MYKVKASFPLPLREDWTDASLTILKPFHIEVAALEDVKALYNTQASLKLCLISQACELIQCKERQCRVILVNNIFLCIHLSCPQATHWVILTHLSVSLHAELQLKLMGELHADFQVQAPSQNNLSYTCRFYDIMKALLCGCFPLVNRIKDSMSLFYFILFWSAVWLLSSLSILAHRLLYLERYISQRFTVWFHPFCVVHDTFEYFFLSIWHFVWYMWLC